MKKLLPIIMLFVTTKVLSQNVRDTILNSLPLVDGKLVYADSVTVKNQARTKLDSTARKWFVSYFKYYQADTLANDRDSSSSVLSKGLLEFRMTTTSLALVKYNFYVVITMKIICKDNNYSYRISDIYFMPKGGVFRAVIYYQSSPEYLIGLLNKKHLGIVDGINMGRKKIGEYLSRTNDAVRTCIASLNKAMLN
ncbi:MAG TPA: hypothetical protein VGI43_17390 [Mucilaginibacter sp.]|jgi:hypothetical protein